MEGKGTSCFYFRPRTWLILWSSVTLILSVFNLIAAEYEHLPEDRFYMILVFRIIQVLINLFIFYTAVSKIWIKANLYLIATDILVYAGLLMLPIFYNFFLSISSIQHNPEQMINFAIENGACFLTFGLKVFLLMAVIKTIREDNMETKEPAYGVYTPLERNLVFAMAV